MLLHIALKIYVKINQKALQFFPSFALHEYLPSLSAHPFIINQYHTRSHIYKGICILLNLNTEKYIKFNINFNIKHLIV